jgi:hypothetical protein
MRKGKVTNQFPDNVNDTIGKGVLHYVNLPPSSGSPGNKRKPDKQPVQESWLTLHRGGMHNSVRGRELSTTNSKITRENNEQNDMNDRTEMAVGQSQSKLS